MKRRSFISSSLIGSLGIVGLSSFKKIALLSQQNIKITITPWSLMRTGYGGDDPQGIDVFDYPAVAKSLGFEHPTTKKEVFFDSDLADDMQELIEKWRKYATHQKL